MTDQSAINTVLGHLRDKNYKRALGLARSLTREMPQSAVPHNLAGLSLSGMGKHREAISSYRKAIKSDPGFADARRNAAQSLILIGDIDTARQLLTNLVAKAPQDEPSWYLLAQCEWTAGDPDAADRAISAAIALNPRAGRNLNLRGTLRDRQGDVLGALADFEAALQADPGNVEALVNISLPLARQLRPDDAIAALERAVRIAPGHVRAWIQLARLQAAAGRTGDAVQSLDTVLSLDKRNATAIEELAGLQDSAANAPLRKLAAAALKSVRKSSLDHACLLFATARFAAQDGDRDAEIRALSAANGVMATLQPCTTDADDRIEARILARFPAAPATMPPTDPDQRDTPTPIYVLGLPRSGTTLAEAILGAHPGVVAMGERATSGALLKDIIDTDAPFTPADIAAFRENDARLRPAVTTGADAIVDKMPDNYRLIGFLKAAWPDCRIVHLVRDPRDIALSMWRGHFSGSALNYTYDQAAMAHRFNGYARMMAHWHRVFPGQIHDVRYEDLVADVETTGAAMAAFCGIDWHPDMARPHEHAGQVLTMSAQRVRQPINSRSIGSWRPYESALAQFLAGLDPALWAGRMD
jgi:tetratricopeptide (TPR) repeat protein